MEEGYTLENEAGTMMSEQEISGFSLSKEVEQEQEMTSSSITLDTPAAFADIFGNSEAVPVVEKASSFIVASDHSRLEAPIRPIHAQASTLLDSTSPLPMAQLVREQSRKIRELELVNVDLVGEVDRISRSKDQLIAALQAEVQKWRTETRDKELRVSAIQGKADQMDLIQVEHESLKREAEDVRFERDGLLVRLEKSNTDAVNARNELRNAKIELNTSALEIARLKLELETSSNQVTNMRPAIEGVSSEKQLLSEQLLRERQEAGEQAAKLARAADDLVQAERREAAMQAEISSLRRRVGDLESYERELVAARRTVDRLDNELREISAENSFMRSQVLGSGRQTTRSYNQEHMSASALVNSYTGMAATGSAGSPPRPSTAAALNIQAQVSPSPSVAKMLAGAPISGPSKSLLPANSPTLAPQPPSPQPQPRRVKPVFREEEGRPPLLKHYQAPSVVAQPQPQSLAEFVRIPGPPAPIITQSSSAPLPAPPAKTQSAAPFATESSSAALAKTYEAAEKALTVLICEKTSLREEGARYVSHIYYFFARFRPGVQVLISHHPISLLPTCYAQNKRLHQRGGKTLKERTRLTQVELRLTELDKEIAQMRRQLTQKPL